MKKSLYPFFMLFIFPYIYNIIFANWCFFCHRKDLLIKLTILNRRLSMVNDFCFQGSRSHCTWWRKTCPLETRRAVYFYLWCVKRFSILFFIIHNLSTGTHKKISMYEWQWLEFAKGSFPIILYNFLIHSIF